MKTPNYFYRYTELKYLEQMLRRKALRLGSPKRWPDRNDAFTVELYRRREGLGRVLALCMTSSKERSHHWSNFAPGKESVCIRFRGPGLLRWANDILGMRCEPVRYRKLKTLEKVRPRRTTLPFLKRYAYLDEKEYRLLYGDDKDGFEEKWFALDLKLIDQITINPRVSQENAAAIKASLGTKLKRLKVDIRVQQSRLLENERWKQLAAQTIVRGTNRRAE